MLLALLWLMHNNVHHYLTILLLYWIVIFAIFITLFFFLITKRWRQGAILLFVVVFLSFSFYLLGVQTPPLFREVLDCHSDCILDSKESNAFICEYSSVYNSKYNIKINEAFVEYRREYKNYFSRDYHIDRNSSWLIANIDDISTIKQKGYGKIWEIEKTSNSRIVLPVNVKDTIILHLNDKTTMNGIDSLILIKKESGKVP